MKRIKALATIATILLTVNTMAYSTPKSAKFKFSANGFKSSLVPKTMELTYSSDEISSCLYGEFPDVLGEPEGYVFLGWATEKDGKVKYEAGDWIENWQPNKTHRFYAVWKKLG